MMKNQTFCFTFNSNHFQAEPCQANPIQCQKAIDIRCVRDVMAGSQIFNDYSCLAHIYTHTLYIEAIKCALRLMNFVFHSFRMIRAIQI